MAPTHGKENKHTAASKFIKDGRVKKKGTSDRITQAATKRIKHAYDKNQKSPLLRLPGELRNRIFEYTIGGNQIEPYFSPKESDDVCEVRARAYNGPNDFSAKYWHDLFALSLVCRQLRRETQILPYSLNIFHIWHGNEFGTFLGRLKDDYAKAITTISVGYHCRWDMDGSLFPYTIPHNMEKCTGLETIIRLDSLHTVQKDQVKDFVLENGLEMIDEKKVGGGWCDAMDDFEEHEMNEELGIYAEYDSLEEEY